MPESLTHEARIARARFRAWHRGTREADYLIGGYFDRYFSQWDDAQLRWFEHLLDCEDADVLAWAMRTAQVPSEFAGPQMELMQRLDYVKI